MSRDFDKLKSMIRLLEPGAIYVASQEPFAAALAAIEGLHDAAVVSGRESDGAIPLHRVAATPETADVAQAFAAIGPDTTAKLLFTSGSTGTPKAVINSQRMLTSSQQAKAQTWPFSTAQTIWCSSTGCHGLIHSATITILILVLRNGGTLYIDGGEPAPGLFATSLANLRSVMPTIYFNVPRGFDMLIAALRDDEPLRRRFFGEVKFAFYAGAALPQNLWDAMEELSIRTTGRVLPVVWGLGLDGNLAARHRLPFPGQAFRQYRRADPRHQLKLVPSATSSKSACAVPMSRRATGRRRS